tara:strand:- start:432 stop:737 length:306 start_codon:yes stop_codon:yes gene_type:complete
MKLVGVNFYISPFYIMKRKNNKITKRAMLNQLDSVTRLALTNQKSLEVIGEFLYNYLEMKEDTESYTKFMEEKINVLKQGQEGIDKVSRESIQEESSQEEE